ncbi:MAG: hypothetical protein JL57_02010 [Desulfosporosinus sp. BICA1-9]|nr:MAG: hypothetical protein JL57_02010 [Desulfosporosinus sp. BICA1-9]
MTFLMFFSRRLRMSRPFLYLSESITYVTYCKKANTCEDSVFGHQPSFLFEILAIIFRTVASKDASLFKRVVGIQKLMTFFLFFFRYE